MPKEKKPNIVFAFADDWGRYASIYSKYENVAPLTSSVNEFIHTPNFDRHSALLSFSTQTKSSEDKIFFSTCYDVKEVRISQEKHLSSGFPLSYQLTSASQSAY